MVKARTEAHPEHSDFGHEREVPVDHPPRPLVVEPEPVGVLQDARQSVGRLDPDGLDRGALVIVTLE